MPRPSKRRSAVLFSGSKRASARQATSRIGRLIVGNAGILLTRVLYLNLKRGEAKTFVIVDAGMNDLIRPTLYEAHHDIRPVREPRPDAARIVADVAGPVVLVRENEWALVRPRQARRQDLRGPAAVVAARPVVAVASDTAAALALPSDLSLFRALQSAPPPL